MHCKAPSSKILNRIKLIPVERCLCRSINMAARKLAIIARRNDYYYAVIANTDIELQFKDPEAPMNMARMMSEGDAAGLQTAIQDREIFDLTRLSAPDIGAGEIYADLITNCNELAFGLDAADVFVADAGSLAADLEAAGEFLLELLPAAFAAKVRDQCLACKLNQGITNLPVLKGTNALICRDGSSSGRWRPGYDVGLLKHPTGRPNQPQDHRCKRYSLSFSSLLFGPQ